MLDRLKNLSTDRLDFDEAMALYSFGTGLASHYAEFTLDTPEWLSENLRVLESEIKSRRRDALTAALKRAEGRRETLKSADVKRRETEAEIKRLKAQLA